MGELRHSLGLWRRLAGARARSQLQYRASFTMLSVAAILAPAIELAALLLVFTNTPELAGWSRGEVLFLYAVTVVAFTTGDALVGCVDTVSDRIRDGSFDGFLLRPVNSLVHVCADAFALRRVARVAFCAALLAGVAASGVVRWTPGRVVVTALGLVTGFTIFSAIFVATSAFAFWVVDSREFGNAFTYGGGFLAQQPLDIYGTWLRRFVVYVLPVAFAVFLPVAWVLEKPSPAGLPREAALLSPVVAAASAAVAMLVWRAGVRHYRSTGS
ncbi:MAG TPA: ABC-2 family transporter protein [Frankiaceae bacterium]|nr:ABC-2 family transporter protein [Frankiaceae bacterium]